MIKPIIFPFTHLTRKDAHALSAVFKSCVVLSMNSEKELAGISREWMDTGSFEFIPMPDKDLKPVIKSLNAFTEFAEIHRKDPDVLKAMLREKPFCTANNDVSAISSKIRKDSKEEYRDKENQDKDARQDQLLQALLFLRLAHQWDADTEAIDENFSKMDKKESELFNALKCDWKDAKDDGKETITGKPVGKPENFLKADEGLFASGDMDHGMFMVEKRIHSWTFRLMMHMSRIKGGMKGAVPDKSTPFFVTTSAAAMSLIKSMAENSKLILDIKRLKVHEHDCEEQSMWQNEFSSCIERFLSGEDKGIDMPLREDDCCSMEVDIKFYLFSGDSVKNLFCFSEDFVLKNTGGYEKFGHVPVCFLGLK